MRKTENRIKKKRHRVKYFIAGVKAKLILTVAKKRGILPKNSRELYRALSKAHMDIK